MAIGMMKKFIIRKLLEIDLMNIHMINIIIHLFLMLEIILIIMNICVF